MKIPVLFVHARSNYKKLDTFDCYDEKRNALSFTGSLPVIVHPPCRLFSRLRGMSCAPPEEKELAYWAVDLVRKNGGVLEHPVGSTLWKDKNLPLPGQYDEFGGFTICINQSWFGYYAEKRTLLYIVGIKMGDLPGYPLSFDAVQKMVPQLTKKQRSETTVELCMYLAEIIKKIGFTGVLSAV